MAAKKTNRLRAAGARRQRTLQHQTLSPKTRHAIDTEAWFRGLLLERYRGSDSDRRWASKDQVHDEAITWFLQKHAQQPLSDYPARRTGDEDLTFWVDSKIMERVRRLALREGVKVARLIDAALSIYARAVSYTHLDVYKRQDYWMDARTGWRLRFAHGSPIRFRPA